MPQLLPWGQLAAIDVFNAAIGFANGNQTSPSSQLPPPTPVPASSEPKHGPTAGRIIGGVLGGVCAIVLMAVTAWIFLRRRKDTRKPPSLSSIDVSLFRKNLTRSHPAYRNNPDFIVPFPPPMPPIGSSTSMCSLIFMLTSCVFQNFQKLPR